MRSYLFPSIVMLTALALAAGAALFTILGFRELFEATVKITYMAATIEFGKIIAVSALYQFRDMLNWLWKSILFSLIVVAMAVTSMGVYGYLSSSYQKDTLLVTKNDARLTLLDNRKTVLEERLQGIDTQIAEVPEAYVTKRMELIATFKPERAEILSELNTLEQEKLDLTLERIEKETEFGAVILLAKSIEGLDANKAMLYFILAVIFIFDPMAIALTYAANVGYYNISQRRKEEQNTPMSISSVDPLDKDALMGEINSVLESNKQESSEVINNIVTALESISNEITGMKERKPDPRSSVLDSMRS